MKKIILLIICAQFSLVSFSQSVEELAKSASMQLVYDFKLSSDQFYYTNDVNIMFFSDLNDINKSLTSEVEKNAAILKLEEKRNLLFKGIFSPEQFLEYQKKIKLASNPKDPSSPETAEDIANKELNVLTFELKLKTEQIKPVYSIILAAAQKNEAMKTTELKTEEKELVIIRNQESKTAMLKEALSPEHFNAYQNYLILQAKINLENQNTVPQKKKVTPELISTDLLNNE